MAGLFHEAAFYHNLMLEGIGAMWAFEVEWGIVRRNARSFTVQFGFESEIIELEGVIAFGKIDALFKGWASVIQSEMPNIPDPNYIESINVWAR